jgi:hypothetical protein
MMGSLQHYSIVGGAVQVLMKRDKHLSAIKTAAAPACCAFSYSAGTVSAINHQNMGFPRLHFAVLSLSRITLPDIYRFSICQSGSTVKQSVTMEEYRTVHL